MPGAHRVQSTCFLEAEIGLQCFFKTASLRFNSHTLQFTLLKVWSWASQVDYWIKNPPASTGDCRFDPWVRKIPWRIAWQPTPVFLPEEPHGQRSLAGYSLWGQKRGGHYWSNLAHMHSSIRTIREHWGTHLRQSVIFIEPLSEKQMLHRQVSAANHSGSHDMSDPWSRLYEGTLHEAKVCSRVQASLVSVQYWGQQKH